MKETPLKPFTQSILEATGNITNQTLHIVRDSVNGILKLTGDSLVQLKDISNLFFREHDEFTKNLHDSSHSVFESAKLSYDGLNNAIANTSKAFRKAIKSIEVADKYLINSVFDNKVISSILGSAHDELFNLSTMKMSFRYNHRDTTPEKIYNRYKNSKLNQIILFIPGLFCDETLWTKPKLESNANQDKFIYLADYFQDKGYYPIIVRYNHGRHISENGKDLYKLLKDLFEIDSTLKVNMISYSQGGLVFRSMLYYANLIDSKFSEHFLKSILISSPDCGSYLEKAGYWFAHGMVIAPNIFLRIIGIIGNFRSDGIKDLSFGIIREEDWKNLSNVHLIRYTKEHYFGELDSMDTHQIFSTLSETDSLISNFFGDGIIEYPSLTYLSNRVYNKGLEIKSHRIMNENHFTIMDSYEMLWIVKQILLK